MKKLSNATFANFKTLNRKLSFIVALVTVSVSVATAFHLIKEETKSLYSLHTDAVSMLIFLLFCKVSKRLDKSLSSNSPRKILQREKENVCETVGRKVAEVGDEKSLHRALCRIGI